MKNQSPFEKEKKIRKELLQYIQSHQQGKHITDIQKETKISRKTLEKHLYSLEYENEVYHKQYGPTKVYFPNEKAHNIDYEVIKMANRVIFADLIKNEFGLFILIKEKRRIYNEWKQMGSILIPIEKAKDFSNKIASLVKSEKISELMD